MAWFKVDDGFYTSPKFLCIARDQQVGAAGLWLLAGTWSADKMTDGFIPYPVLSMWVHAKDAIEQLIAVGLWLRDEERGGVQFHDWCDYQPLRAELEAKSAQRSQKAKQNVAKRWDKDKSDTNAIPTAYETNTNGIQIDTPEPEPEPEPSLSKDRERACRLPQDFKITNEMRAWFESKSLVVDVETETEKFMNYYSSISGSAARKIDWVATWRNWLLKANEWAKPKDEFDPWAGKQVFK